MVGVDMSRGALAMISRLQQQEFEIQGVISTIYGNIDQLCRSELVVCLPKLHKGLSSLLGKHFHGTKHLVRKLGEDHPMATMWMQRVDEVYAEANEAIRCLGIVLRNFDDDWWWGTDELEDNTSAQAEAASELRVAEDVVPAVLQVDSGGTAVDTNPAARHEAAPQVDTQAAAGPQGADSIQPAALQVQVNVCTVMACDAASNLPIGGVAALGTADADTAFRPQDALAEGGQQREEAQPAAGIQTADTIQPATDQVQVCTVKVNDAAANLPAGNVDSGDAVAVDTDKASRPQDAQADGGQQREEALAAAVDTMQPETEQVQVYSVEFNDAAYNLPPGTMVIGDQPSHAEVASQPSQILNRCLARASAAANKLDRLSGSQAKDGKPALASLYPTNKALQSPGAQLDSVLARTASLLEKLNNLSSRVSGTKKCDQTRG